MRSPAQQVSARCARWVVGAGAGAGGTMEAHGAGRARGEKTICFDCSKREIFTPSNGLKVLRRKLNQTYKMSANKDMLTIERLREASVLVLAGPREKFSQAEFEALKQYLAEGGSIFITLGTPATRVPRPRSPGVSGQPSQSEQPSVAAPPLRARLDRPRPHRRGRRERLHHQHQLLHRGVWHVLQLGRGHSLGLLQVHAPEGGAGGTHHYK